MTRSTHPNSARAGSILTALFGLLSVAAIGFVPTACQSGGVGDPCTPEDEYNPQFSGFKVTEENIESRSFQCETRICLVNHFQGRVSCPLGQNNPVRCTKGDDSPCGDGKCVEAGVLAPSCDPKSGDKGAADCSAFGGQCNPSGAFCECGSANSCPEGFGCECQNEACTVKVCTTYVCHKANGCQIPGAEKGDNEGKDCCVPGTDTPIAAPVCGQCATDTNRDAADAVYCSCRCCPPCSGDIKENCGDKCDPAFNYCDCPDDYSCTEIRKNVGLGDKQLTGAYCIKNGSKWESEAQCSKIDGQRPPDAQCFGISGL